MRVMYVNNITRIFKNALVALLFEKRCLKTTATFSDAKTKHNNYV